MLRIFSLFFISGLILTACNKGPHTVDNGIVGEWKLTEQLMDPGDGSGVFTNVNSNKVIIFDSNGSFYCNGSICFPDTSTANASSGTYDTISQTLSGLNCGIVPFDITYEMSNGDLIINYPCIEACREKFVKIN